MVYLKNSLPIRLDIALLRVTDFHVKLLLIAAVVFKLYLPAVHKRSAGFGISPSCEAQGILLR